MIVTGPEVGEWVTARTGYKFKGPHSCMGYIRDGKILSAAVFQNWSGEDIELTIAADDLPRSFLHAIWKYVVGQLGCRRATFRTPADNHAAIQAMFRLGAKLEGQQRRYYGNTDALIFGILSEEYPYGEQ